MLLSEFEKNLKYKNGAVLQNVPAPLAEKFTGIKLLQPRNIPGIYGFYFPSIDKIYLGQAKRISTEMSMYRTGQRTQFNLNQLFRSEGKNVFSFALFEGEPFLNETLRREVEVELIKKTQNFNINTVSTPRHLLALPSEYAKTSFLTCKTITGSLAQYGLKYTGIEPPKDQGCIYMFINPKTNNFYIGETSNFFKANVIKRHRTTLFSYAKRQKKLDPSLTENVSKRILDDLNEDKNTLFFTCLQIIQSGKKNDRLAVETQWKKEVFNTYGDRLYNTLNYEPKIGFFVQTAESKERIRQAVLKQDIVQDFTEYPCICEGKWYKNRAEASRAYNYRSKDGIKRRLNNPNLVDFIWLKDTKGKPIPNTPEIQNKIKEWEKTFKPKEIKEIKRNL